MARFAAALALAAAAAAAPPASTTTTKAAAPAWNPVYGVRALAAGDRLISCAYVPLLGVWPLEQLWQSGNTIESLSNYLLARQAAEPAVGASWRALVANTYAKTPDIVDNCFDDHQWWLLAWVRAYQATGEAAYLARAAVVFNYTATKGWDGVCGGGVDWCPVAPGKSPYKNSVTIELFLTSAMELHAYEAVLGVAPGYYLGWGAKAWAWFSASGLINAQNLINDGLSDACVNSGATEWTYNQGVLLDGLGLLGAATGNVSLFAAAEAITAAVMAKLSPGGVLQEPCGSSCDADQHIFKGIFMRHLTAFVGVSAAGGGSAAARAAAAAYVTANADSLLNNDTCPFGGYGNAWAGPCDSSASVASLSSAMDLLTGAAMLSAPVAPPSAGGPAWVPLGLGNCGDATGAAMPSCAAENVSEAACAAAASADGGSVAYDFSNPCDGSSVCRVRTLSGAASCASGWKWADGPAKSVTTADGASLVVCVQRAA